MQNLHEFRLFYNRTLHPELRKQERTRKQLIFFFIMSISILILSGLVVYRVQMPVIILLTWIPIVAWSSFLGWQIQRFRADFKPKIVQLILDFIVHPMTYSHKAFLPKTRFLQSRFFTTKAPYYKGEDYIAGKIGRLHFEMCELDVRENSKVGSGSMIPVFRGIFFIAKTKNAFNGEIVILPKSERPYLSRTIKDLLRRGDRVLPVKHEGFEDKFLTYVSTDANVELIIHEAFFGVLFDFAKRLDKKVYMSFVEGYIYIGVWEPKDILEPRIFDSNASFKLVKEFYNDLYNIVSVVEDFDRLH